ncbi:MAG: rhomboid family intramembrane serine protease [Candidatus Aenigmatarchaeota archaeon]
MARLCAATVISAICILVSSIAWLGNTELIFSEFGYSTENLFLGKLYVLVTSIFLHSNIDHLLSNILVLVIFGVALEKEIGCRKTLILFFSGAFLGDLMSSLIYSFTQIAVGASAGVFAVVAATMIIKPVQMEYMVPIPLGVIAIGYIIYAIVGLLTNYPPHVAHIAHLGGALVGLCYGCRRQGLRSTFRILIAVTIILLFAPLIWNFWVLLVQFILGAV